MIVPDVGQITDAVLRHQVFGRDQVVLVCFVLVARMNAGEHQFTLLSDVLNCLLFCFY